MLRPGSLVSCEPTAGRILVVPKGDRVIISADGDRPGLRLFCSYAHEDRVLLDEVRKHLTGLERSGVISGWDDRMITAGSDWEGRILDALEHADVILLLISADFLASDYCWDVEMRRALVRQAAAEALVVPIILRPCDWMSAPFARLQCLPSDGRPIVSWSPRDEGYLDVAAGLRRALAESLDAMRREAGDAARRTSRQVEAREARVLDAAVARVVPVGRATDIVAMVRMPESGGLRAILETDTSYSAEPGDVRVADFEMDFPVDPEGRPEKVQVVLRLEGSDFTPPSQEKTIEVRPGEESRTCVFLATPAHAGALVLNLELRYRGVSVVQQLLRTNGSLGVDRRALPAYVVHSAGFAGDAVPGTAGSAPPPAPAPPEPDRAAAPGDFTQLYRSADPRSTATEATLAGAPPAPPAPAQPPPPPAPPPSASPGPPPARAPSAEAGGEVAARGCVRMLLGVLLLPALLAVVHLLLLR